MAIKRNVGGADKTVRLIAGVALPAFALLSGGNALLRGLAGMLGVTALTTGLTGYCPLNSLLGIDTRKEEQQDKLLLPLETQSATPSSAKETLIQENRALLH